MSKTLIIIPILLYLFLQQKDTATCEQITRVLLERLIVHRPHPWGLLITFIELIKNPRYKFWEQGFTRCAPALMLPARPISAMASRCRRFRFRASAMCNQ